MYASLSTSPATASARLGDALLMAEATAFALSIIILISLFLLYLDHFMIFFVMDWDIVLYLPKTE